MGKVDAQAETKIIALKARGDTLAQIQERLQKENSLTITKEGIRQIVEKNKESLSYIQTKLLDHETKKTTRILDKARNQIEDKLNNVDKYEDEKEELRKLHKDGEIDSKEYVRLLESLIKRTHISIKDLTSLSKEMFNQSQIESGKPTSITENPAQLKENFQNLMKAIQSGDEKAIAEAIFIDV